MEIDKIPQTNNENFIKRMTKKSITMYGDIDVNSSDDNETFLERDKSLYMKQACGFGL